MLTDLHHPDTSGAEIKISEIKDNHPFYDGLEYSCPSRGNWTIAHTAMLVPGAHQIYVGASACMRGVVLSAAEFEGLDRFSMVMIEEKDILSGDMEELFIEGVTDILNKLDRKPTAVLAFTGCIHHFLAADTDYIYSELRRRFPDIDFVDCKMNPTMKKTEITAEENMRRKIYDPLPNVTKDPRSVNVIGSNKPFTRSGDQIDLLEKNGFTVRDICNCYDYAEYKKMATSFLNIYSLPVSGPAVVELKERIGQDFIYMPCSYDYDEIERDMRKLAERIGAEPPDFDECREKAEEALAKAKKVVGDMPIAIDYVSTPRFFGMAELLLGHGFNVKEIYGDVVLPDDMPALKRLAVKYPDLPFKATINYKRRLLPRDAAAAEGGKFLAIGPKAAYFTGTEHFVNMIENDGNYGFDGIVKLAEAMIEAARTTSDVPSVIQVKGWGCSA